jgi:hypothetical protein
MKRAAMVNRTPVRPRATSAHPAALPVEILIKQCDIEFGRASGPGGQHRNKVETAVSITHRPTGTSASATERRSQSQNRHRAIWRLRIRLAIEHRQAVDRHRHQPSELWRSRRQGEKLSVNPEHDDYPGLLAEALDVIMARDGDVAGAAGLLGVTMSQLVKLLRHEKQAIATVNAERVRRGLPPLR